MNGLFAATLQALAPLFGLIALGYLLKRGRVLHAAHAPVLNGLVVNATLPALVIHSLLHAPAIPHRAALLPLILLAVEAILALLAALTARLLRWPAPLAGAAIMVSSFGNSGFLGYPITLALMPAQFSGAVLLDQFGMSTGLYTAAPLVGSLFGGSKADFRAMLGKIVRSPMLIAAALGILLRQFTIPAAVAAIPAIAAAANAIDSCLSYLGQGTTPLVLLALGVSLRPGAVVRSVRPLMVSCTFKLIASPLIMWLLCLWAKMPSAQTALAVLIGAMPTSVMASVLSGQHDLDDGFAVATVFVTTILSVATIPFWLSLLR